MRSAEERARRWALSSPPRADTCNCGLENARTYIHGACATRTFVDRPSARSPSLAMLLAQLVLVAVAAATPLVRRDSSLMGVIPGKAKLTFDKDGRFKIVSFSDMHMAERPGAYAASLARPRAPLKPRLQATVVGRPGVRRMSAA
jgi:hypothetical protein